MITRQKLDIIQHQMKIDNIDLLFLRLSHNVMAFLGYWCGGHTAAAVMPSEGKPVLLVSETEVEYTNFYIDGDLIDVDSYPLESAEILRGPMDGMAEKLPKILDKLGVAGGRIGIEESSEDGSSANFFGEFKYPGKPTFDKLKALFPNACFVDAEGFISRLKRVKTPEEIVGIERAAALVCAGFDKVREALSQGMTEAEVSMVMENHVHINGTGKNIARYSRCFPSVYTGKRSGDQWIHWAATSGRVVEKDDLVIIEIGSVTDGYWCDLTRCFCAGKPSDKMLKVLDIVLEGQRRGIERMKPGVPVSEIDRVCHDYFKKFGYGEEVYKHGSGHGVGFNYHEGPPIHPACDVLLEEGMVMCVEPGIYLKGEFGIRIEDMVVITRDGARVISNASRGLIR